MSRRILASRAWLRSGRVLISLLLPLVAAGCVQLPGMKGPAPRLYSLAPEIPRSHGKPAVRWQLVVAEPATPAALDTDRIALRPGPLQIEYYANARWADRAPKMVQRLLIKGFEGSGRIVAVGASGRDLRADYELDSELWDFSSDYRRGGGAPTVRVRLVAKMVREADADIVAARSFSAHVAAGSDTLPAIAAAFDAALGQVIGAVVPWALAVPGAAGRSSAGGD